MGLFLQEQGKLEDFKTWSVAEQKRRDDELEQQRPERGAELLDCEEPLHSRISMC